MYYAGVLFVFCWRLAEWKLLLGLEAVEDTPAGFSEAIGVD
jgi:hypothetical protein